MSLFLLPVEGGGELVYVCLYICFPHPLRDMKMKNNWHDKDQIWQIQKEIDEIVRSLTRPQGLQDRWKVHITVFFRHCSLVNKPDEDLRAALLRSHTGRRIFRITKDPHHNQVYALKKKRQRRRGRRRRNRRTRRMRRSVHQRKKNTKKRRRRRENKRRRTNRKQNAYLFLFETRCLK